MTRTTLNFAKRKKRRIILKTPKEGSTISIVMQTISINLPDTLSDFVHWQSAEHGVDEYFVRILREQQGQARNKLEAELIKGIESGFGEPITPEYWERMREKLQQYIDRKGRVQQ